MENLLGHPLGADQQVMVMVFAAGKVPNEAARRAAAESIRRTLAEVDRHRVAHGITDDAADAAVDEAMQHVRPRAS